MTDAEPILDEDMNIRRPVTGRTVLVWVLAFFGFIFAANGALVFFALDSWPGLVSDKAYDEGVSYNRTLDAAAVQARRGWSSELAFVPGGKTGDGNVQLRLTGPDKAPVTGLKARVRFHRPVGDDFEETALLKEIAAGLYAAPVALPLSGRWYAEIDVRRKQDTVYRMRHEFMVTPRVTP